MKELDLVELRTDLISDWCGEGILIRGGTLGRIVSEYVGSMVGVVEVEFVSGYAATVDKANLRVVRPHLEVAG